MSSVFKSFKSNDISLVPYTVNKPWVFNKDNMENNGVSLFIGENIPINRNSPFNPVNDTLTTNQEYKRLIFNTVRHLYYDSYISGNLSGMFFTSTPFENYNQTTLYSGSYPTTIKDLSPITGTAFDINSQGYDNITYDSSSVYDETMFDPNKGGLILVISVPQNIMGNGLQPNTIFLSGSGYYIHDDGQGNIIDFSIEQNYIDYINNREFTSADLNYIGNVFYSHGLIVVTKSDYICVLGTPPTTLNDYFTYLNVNGSGILDITSNDFADCGIIDYSSVEFYEYEGYEFPDFTIDGNGFMVITPNHKSYIPGEYKLKYAVRSNTGNLSNISDINMSVTSKPLEINNLVIPALCNTSITSSQPLTFSINYGVPFYSYSLDGVNYTGINTLDNITIRTTINPLPENTIYVTDYIGNTTQATFSIYYPRIYVNTTVFDRSLCNDGTIKVEYTGSNPVIGSINNFSSSYSIPHIFDSPPGNYTLILRDTISECLVTQSLIVGNIEQLTTNTIITPSNCNSRPTGSMITYPSGGIGPYDISWIDPDNITIYGDTIDNLKLGQYSLTVIDSTNCRLDATVDVVPPTPFELSSVTPLYSNACFSSLQYEILGGSTPFTYYATNGTNIFQSNTNIIELQADQLLGGTYSVFVVDASGCTTPTGSITIYSREYQYSGSYCEQE